MLFPVQGNNASTISIRFPNDTSNALSKSSPPSKNRARNRPPVLINRNSKRKVFARQLRRDIGIYSSKASHQTSSMPTFALVCRRHFQQEATKRATGRIILR